MTIFHIVFYSIVSCWHKCIRLKEEKQYFHDRSIKKESDINMPRRRRDESHLSNTILRERMIFVNNFRNTRKEAKITQKEIRNRTGFAQSWISELETGKSTINIDNMIILAHTLNTPLWKLLKP